MRLGVCFDGHYLSDAYVVCHVERPLMGAPSLTSRDVPGRDGTIFLGIRREAPVVSVTLASLRSAPDDMRRDMRRLAGWLAVDGPRKLEFSDEPGLYRLAVPSGVGEMETLGLVNGRVQVDFTVPDACLHGSKRSYRSAAGTCAVSVGGTLPTPVLLEAEASGDFAVMDVGSGNVTSVSVGVDVRQLVVDAGEATATVGGRAAMINLDSDWLVLAPGRHTLRRIGGSGEFTATVEERWA